MFRIHASLLVLSCLALTSCHENVQSDQVVSQKYVHKYGFEVPEEEWSEREQDGQVVSVLKNGIRLVRSFENGLLHGPTTYTFPHSNTVEKRLVYDQGTLLKESLFDPAGMPIREDVYEFDDRNIITLWDEKGVPLSVEEYDSDVLMEGKYYTSEHELEGQVVAGFGERIKRDRSGQLLSRDRMENGLIAERTTFHPNGEIQSISHYDHYQLHGEQLKFTATGKPLMRLQWDHGVLDGQKIVYRNGIKLAEIPYVNGQKQGVEHHFDDLGNLTADILWKSDKKHGCSQFYTDENTETEWFFKGQAVNAERYKMLEEREQFIADAAEEMRAE